MDCERVSAGEMRAFIDSEVNKRTARRKAAKICEESLLTY